MTDLYRPLDDRAAAAPQILPADMAAIRDAGFVGIVNNRPDGEEPGQPAHAEIAAAAAAAGLVCIHVPLGREPLTDALIAKMRAALDEVGQPAFLFCRSGTRSTTLWALAEADAGRDADELVRLAGAAGYDLAPLRDTLAARAAG